MRVFLDTNVIISAFTARGLCADLFREILESHDLITSEDVLREVEHVLSYKMSMPGREVRASLQLLRNFHVEPTPSELPRIKLRDADDLLILAAALVSHADVLVTGDKDLLVLAPMKELKI